MLPDAPAVAGYSSYTPHLGAHDHRRMSPANKDPHTTQRTVISGGPNEDSSRSACVVVIHGEGLGRRVDVEDEPVVRQFVAEVLRDDDPSLPVRVRLMRAPPVPAETAAVYTLPA